MNFVFLHGPPATGKYTIGRELAAITRYRFFHNHLVVDALLAVFDFGSPAFIELREGNWRDVFVRAAHERIPGLIFTFNSENTVSQEFIDWIFAGLPALGVTVHSVALTATEPELERRLSGTSRRDFRKLTDVALYRELRAAGTFNTPVIPRLDLTIDTERSDAGESARRIAATFHLA
jgi:hypothetical protein